MAVGIHLAHFASSVLLFSSAVYCQRAKTAAGVPSHAVHDLLHDLRRKASLFETETLYLPRAWRSYLPLYASLRREWNSLPAKTSP